MSFLKSEKRVDFFRGIYWGDILYRQLSQREKKVLGKGIKHTLIMITTHMLTGLPSPGLMTKGLLGGLSR